MHTNQAAAGRGVLQRPGSQVGGAPDPEMPPRLRPDVQSWTGVTPSHLHCPGLAMSLQRGGGEAGAKAILPTGQWEDEPLGTGQEKVKLLAQPQPLTKGWAHPALLAK